MSHLRHRARVAALLAVLVTLLMSVIVFSPTAEAVDSPDTNNVGNLAEAAAPAQATAEDSGVVRVVKFNGLLDPVLADFLINALEQADADPRTRAVVLEVNSTGSVVSESVLNDVAAAIADADVAITAWVGPNGARATREVAQLVGLTDRVAVAPGARLGDTGPSVLDARFTPFWGDKANLVLDRTIDHEEAVREGFAPNPAPIIGEFIVQLADEYPVEITLQPDGGNTVDSFVRFERLSVLKSWMHSVASSPVAYLLFVIGMALLVFELYTAGVGLAGLIGAMCLLLGSYGLGILPTRTWAIALLVLSMVAYAIDVQTGVPRFWTAVGTVMFIIGTLFLYTDGVSLSWLSIIVGIAGIVTTMLVGMPTMVRTRFSTPTIGRDWMIGAMGKAIEAVEPDGVVEIRDSLWKARTNRATPIASGAAVRVVAVDGLWLEVEPEDGAAKDYRERG